MILSDTPKIQAFNIDCMEFMKDKPDNYYDLAIVDPPYGIGDKLLLGGHTGKVKLQEQYELNKWDNERPDKIYFAELMRTSRNQIVWGANYFWEFLYPSRGIISWDKNLGSPYNFSHFELAWTSFDCIARRKIIGSNTGGRIHPTQKPIQLYRWLLDTYASCKYCQNQGTYYEDVAGDGGSQMEMACDECCRADRNFKILDTHGGSFSSAIACHMEGYDLDICELDEDYFNDAVKRFKLNTVQEVLF